MNIRDFMVEQVKFFQQTSFLPENIDLSDWKHFPGCINIIQAFAEKSAKMFIWGFFPHLLLTVLFYSCVMRLYPSARPKTWGLLSWGGGALQVQYFSFTRFCFSAHSKNQTTSDNVLVPDHFPAILQPKSSVCFLQQSHSLGLFGLCWALLFSLAALVPYVQSCLTSLLVI